MHYNIKSNHSKKFLNIIYKSKLKKEDDLQHCRNSTIN